MNHHPSLRVALVFNGTIIHESTFTRTSEPVVTVGEDAGASFVVPAPGLPERFEMFERIGAGYRVRVTDRIDGSITRDGEEFVLEEIVGAHPFGTSELTAEGPANVHEIGLTTGDWGLLHLGDVDLFFQVLANADAVAGRGVRGRMEAQVFGALGISGLLHIAFLIVAFLLYEANPDLNAMPDFGRFATVNVSDVKDPLEEEDDTDPSEESSSAKAKGEEGKTGVTDSEIPESKVPKSDGEMVEEFDPNNVGIHKALTAEAMGAGPLKDIFDNQDGFDSRMQIAMAGDEPGTLELGRGENGMGLRGDGRGGGGDSIGRIQGIGGVDTGGGKGSGAKIGPKTERKVKPPLTIGNPNVGDFCDKNNIRRVVNARQNAVKYCFEKQLQTKPQLSGKIVAQWQIGLDGSVTDSSVASSTMNDSDVEGCIARVISRMRFQEPKGGVCVINYPFVFSGIQE